MDRSPFTRSGRSYQRSNESSISDCDISFVSSGRPSVDRMFPSLYDEMDFSRLSTGSDYDARSSSSSYSGAKSIDQGDYSFCSQDSGISMSSLRLSNSEDVEAEMWRLKLELRQTMDMYSTACKEALTAKQKAMELQRWKLEEQRKVEEFRMAEEAALAVAEKEKARAKAAMEAAEANKKIAEFQAQQRMNSESDQKKKTEDTISQGHARYRKYCIEEIENATNNFAPSLKIGEGGYGPVYRCELDHTPVAIKVLKPDASQGRSQFQQEVWKMAIKAFIGSYVTAKSKSLISVLD
ncbi:putative non-specific serine/threonine protein kinase [Lupinus albus]|uniref:RING-type E3 ubiquitin transferase n=1 Tax=Lupinus albus TaxID=3870 RepID=A0A6A4NZ56_LUPAL|nr:putative non-specific serine/threonine protein kinase [Lupinus albus]